jgi:hypothetical protein
VGVDHRPVVHAVQLVAAQDEDLVRLLPLDVRQVLPHRVGRPLVPPDVLLVRLLGGQDLDEPVAEHVELVRVGDVPVQTDAQELGEHVDVPQPAVDAVGNGDVDQTVLAGHRHGRLRPALGEREQTAAFAAAEDESQHRAVL